MNRPLDWLYKLVYLLTLFIVFFSTSGYTQTPNANVHSNEVSPEGNFVLEPAQWPGPLLSFGQILIPKNNQQIQQGLEVLNNSQEYANLSMQSLILGITDSLTFAANLPYIFSIREDDKRNAGVSDPFFQVEYSVYSKEQNNISQEATVLASLSVPINANNKTPSTSLGVQSYFIGATYNITGRYWYTFVSLGNLYFQRSQSAQMGREFFYQAGLGRNLLSMNKAFIFGLIELNGRSINKNTTNFGLDNNSGGNIINITPSIAYTNNHVNIQFGHVIPVYQRWNNKQFKRKGLTLLVLTWTFYN